MSTAIAESDATQTSTSRQLIRTPSCRIGAPFDWTPDRERAAEMIASREHTPKEIMAACKVSHAQLHAWRQHPDFKTRLAQLVLAYGKASERHAIGLRLRRLAAIQRRWEKLQAAFDAGQGIDEFGQVNKPLLDSLLALEERAARECGQWAEKLEVGVPPAIDRMHRLAELLDRQREQAERTVVVEEPIAQDAPGQAIAPSGEQVPAAPSDSPSEANGATSPAPQASAPPRPW